MKNLKIKILLLMIFISIVTGFACKTTSTSPVIEPIIENPVGRRDYTWTIDTIKMPMDNLRRIWGSSSNDVWAMANGGDMDYFLWHYDGQKWNKENLKPYGIIYPNSIFGFSKNNLWLAGDGGKIWHGNGVSWTPNFAFNPPEYRAVYLASIWGDSANNMYAIGTYDSVINGNDVYHGLLFHFDGNEWKRIGLEKNDYQLTYIFKEKQGNGKYYIYGNNFNTKTATDTFKFIEFDGVKLKEIYSVFHTDNSNASMKLVNGKIYFIRNTEICRYLNDQFKVIATISGLNAGFILGGRNETDLFFVMPDGLAHYNGTDLQTIYKCPQSIRMMSMAAFDDAIFIVATDFSGKGFIIKGTLKK